MALRDEQVKQVFRFLGMVPDCSYYSAHGWQGGEIVSVSLMDERGNARSEGTDTLTARRVRRHTDIT